MPQSVVVVVRGGLVQCAEVCERESIAIDKAKEYGDSGFDPESDDIKVFSGDEVIFSYETDQARKARWEGK